MVTLTSTALLRALGTTLADALRENDGVGAKFVDPEEWAQLWAKRAALGRLGDVPPALADDSGGVPDAVVRALCIQDTVAYVWALSELVHALASIATRKEIVRLTTEGETGAPLPFVWRQCLTTGTPFAASASLVFEYGQALVSLATRCLLQVFVAESSVRAGVSAAFAPMKAVWGGTDGTRGVDRGVPSPVAPTMSTALLENIRGWVFGCHSALRQLESGYVGVDDATAPMCVAGTDAASEVVGVLMSLTHALRAEEVMLRTLYNPRALKLPLCSYDCLSDCDHSVRDSVLSPIAAPGVPGLIPDGLGTTDRFAALMHAAASSGYGSSSAGDFPGFVTEELEVAPLDVLVRGCVLGELPPGVPSTHVRRLSFLASLRACLAQLTQLTNDMVAFANAAQHAAEVISTASGGVVTIAPWVSVAICRATHAAQTYRLVFGLLSRAAGERRRMVRVGVAGDSVLVTLGALRVVCLGCGGDADPFVAAMFAPRVFDATVALNTAVYPGVGVTPAMVFATMGPHAAAPCILETPRKFEEECEVARGAATAMGRIPGILDMFKTTEFIPRAVV